MAFPQPTLALYWHGFSSHLPNQRAAKIRLSSKSGKQPRSTTSAAVDPQHDSCGRRHAYGRRSRRRLGNVRLFENLQIVVKRNHTHRQRQQHQPQQTRVAPQSVQRRNKYVELAKEARQRRNPGQRKQKDQQAKRQVRSALAESRRKSAMLSTLSSSSAASTPKAPTVANA